MALLQNMSDDQIALMGCFLAIIVSFGIMSFTLTIRQAVGGSQSIEKTNRSTIEVKGPQSIPERRRTAA
ncbi:MAG: hypothetical protein R3C01_13740 [Planctomycetaceae bacterium]